MLSMAMLPIQRQLKSGANVSCWRERLFGWHRPSVMNGCSPGLVGIVKLLTYAVLGGLRQLHILRPVIFPFIQNQIQC